MKEIKKMLIGEKERKIYVSETYKDGDPCFCICQPKSTPSFNWKVYHFE